MGLPHYPLESAAYRPPRLPALRPIPTERELVLAGFLEPALDAQDDALIRTLRPEAAVSWLITGGSALLSAFLYAELWGIAVGCGLVLGMWAHELGHRAVLRRLGLACSPIVFVPFLGAVQRVGAAPAHPRDAVLLALAGPACGLLFAAGCWLGQVVTGHAGLGFVASVHALLAAIDLLPFAPFDGGRIVAALGRRARR